MTPHSAEFFFHILKLEPLFHHVWPYFQAWLPFLVIGRSKTQFLHKKLGLFFIIKDHMLKTFDGKRADFEML